jgi:hypothetical protein
MRLHEIKSIQIQEQSKDFILSSIQDIPSAKIRLNWPNEIGGSFKAYSNNEITSLEGVPQIIHNDFLIYDNRHLKSLDGGPIQVDGDYLCWGCNLESYEGVATKIGYWLNLYANPITNLKGIGDYFSNGYVQSIKLPSSITSNVLGLLLIPKLEVITLDNKDKIDKPAFLTAMQIINKHLSSGKRRSKCKQELEDAGLKEFAKL